MAKKKQNDEQQNMNQGGLFINDKGGNDKRPDYTGKVLLNAEDFVPNEQGQVLVYLAAWKRESDRVGEYLSLKASPPQQKD